MQTYSVIWNRSGEIAVCDDLEHAGLIVDAMMRTRTPDQAFEDYDDFWVRDSAGNEYIWSPPYRTVFADEAPRSVAS